MHLTTPSLVMHKPTSLQVYASFTFWEGWTTLPAQEIHSTGYNYTVCLSMQWLDKVTRSSLLCHSSCSLHRHAPCALHTMWMHHVQCIAHLLFARSCILHIRWTSSHSSSSLHDGALMCQTKRTIFIGVERVFWTWNTASLTLHCLFHGSSAHCTGLAKM